MVGRFWGSGKILQKELAKIAFNVTLLVILWFTARYTSDIEYFNVTIIHVFRTNTRQPVWKRSRLTKQNQLFYFSKWLPDDRRMMSNGSKTTCFTSTGAVTLKNSMSPVQRTMHQSVTNKVTLNLKIKEKNSFFKWRCTCSCPLLVFEELVIFLFDTFIFRM